MSSVIPNPPLPNPPVYLINAGDSIIFWDYVSKTYVGPPNNSGLSSVSSSASAMVFTVGFNGLNSPSQTDGVLTYGSSTSPSPYSTNISLLSSKGYLWAQSWESGGLQLSSPSSVTNNQPFLWTITAVPSNGSGSTGGNPLTASLINVVPEVCGGACNMFYLSNAADSELKNPFTYVPSQATPSGGYPAYFQLGKGGVQMAKPVTCMLQIFLVSPSAICGSNYDCSSSAPYCLNSKCYPTSSLSQNQIAGICSFSNAAPNNNMVSSVCQNWCTSQPLESTFRYNCDNSMASYCPASNPDGVTHPPITASPCTCILAAASGTSYPECFYSPCAIQPGLPEPQNYYPTNMQNTLNQNDCLQSCQVQFECVDAGTCTVSNNLFCQTCGNSSNPQINKFCGNAPPPNPSGPSSLTKIETWIKNNLPIVIGGSVGLVFAIILIVIIVKQYKGKSQK